MDVKTARKNNEIVSINDSNALRIIRNITGKNVLEEDIAEIKKQIKFLKKQKKSTENMEEIKKLYTQLDDILIVRELNSITFNSMSDWNYVTSKNKKTLLNGFRLRRLVGTSGGVKKNTVLFCHEEIHAKLNTMLINKVDFKKDKFIPAKYEAYKSLAFSGSTPVTQPKYIIVIDDGVVEFNDDVLLLSDNGEGGFNLSEEKDYPIRKNFCDGCGMISESLSKQWTIDMGFFTLDDDGNKVADYTSTGFNLRNAYCKGMVFTYPISEFTNEVAIPSGKSSLIPDAWGNMKDTLQADLIITTNMLKLWKSYDSIEHYLSCCKENEFEFSIAKILPNELENTRNMNYQFLESYEFSDEDIQELIKPTLDSIKGALSEDYLKMLLFLKGCKLSEDDYLNEDYTYIKALMIDERMMKDPFIRMKALRMIEKKINDSKKGVLEVDASYQIVSGDLYGLCQYMFGMEVTGLLARNEFYAKSWLDKGVNKIVSYRAPMTVHNNIKIMPLIENDQTKKWYRFMTTCLIINAWDTTMEAMNGEDFDSDANICSSSDVLLRNTKILPAIICEQHGAEPKSITEVALKQANKNGFYNDVGGITNKCTGMYDVLAKLEFGSKEYTEMVYRIICMQGYQQEIIDSIKGIIPKKVPKHWYDYKTLKHNKDDSKELCEWKTYNQKLMSNKKPYFFVYNYVNLLRRYNGYIKNNDTNCLMRFGLTVDELKDKENKNEEELKFLKYFKLRLPVSTELSVMNRICWALEKEYKGVKNLVVDTDFDYSILKFNVPYSEEDKAAIEQIHKRYKKDIKHHNSIFKNSPNSERNADKSILLEKYEREIFSVCNNEESICDVLLDVCYTGNESKQFVWDMCGKLLVDNLLKLNNYNINIPSETSDKTLTYWGGRYYSKSLTNIKEEN